MDSSIKTNPLSRKAVESDLIHSIDDDDARSEILAGNLDEGVDVVCDLSYENFSDLDDKDDDVTDKELEAVGSLEDIDIADKIFEEQLGVKDMLKSLAKLVILQKILPKDILSQSLAYKIQSFMKGKQSVRYHDSSAAVTTFPLGRPCPTFKMVCF